MCSLPHPPGYVHFCLNEGDCSLSKQSSLHAGSLSLLWAFQTASHNITDITRDRQDKMSLLFCKGKCGIVPPLRSPSGCEWPSNQALPFTAAGLLRAAGLTSEGPASPLPVLWDPSTSFRGQMRCKSIKREFVCRSQSLWGWEPLPCHSGAANFLLLHTQTRGLPLIHNAT